MGSAVVPAYVEVSRAPRRGLLAALWVLAAAILLALALGLFFGAYVSVFALVPLLLVLRQIKEEAAPGEPRVVQVGVVVGERGVVIQMPGARLWSGRYVDQRYSCVPKAVDGAGLDETGTFRLRARVLVSEAVDGGEVLDRREHECGEVSFRPVSAEGVEALRAAFEG